MLTARGFTLITGRLRIMQFVIVVMYNATDMSIMQLILAHVRERPVDVQL